MEEQREDPSHQEKKIQKTPTTLRLRSGTTKGNLLPKILKLGVQPLHTERVFPLTRKVKRIRKRHGTTVSTLLDRSHYMEAVSLHGQQDHWKAMRCHGRYNVILAFGECSWIALFEQVFFGKDYDSNLHCAKNQQRDSLGQLFEKKTDIWTIRSLCCRNTRDRWFEVNWSRRLCMVIDKPNAAWMNQIKCFCRTSTSRNWIASMACERNSSGVLSSQDGRRLASRKRKNMKSILCEPEHFNGGTIFLWIPWHCLDRKQQYRKMCSECSRSLEVCSQIPLRKYMVQDLFLWTKRNLGQNCKNDNTPQN